MEDKKEQKQNKGDEAWLCLISIRTEVQLLTQGYSLDHEEGRISTVTDVFRENV
jgi:hypothetical protein